MNRILSFDRLFKRMCTAEGLAYHISAPTTTTPGYSKWSARPNRKAPSGPSGLYCEKMTQEEVTDEELEKAKDSFLNSWVFNFNSKAKIVTLMTYEYFGYLSDFLGRIKDGVERVTKTDVLRVARKHLHPDELQILVVGNDKYFDEPPWALSMR